MAVVLTLPSPQTVTPPLLAHGRTATGRRGALRWRLLRPGLQWWSCLMKYVCGQKIQSEIQVVQEENKRLKNKLDDQDITIQLIKKNVVLN